MSDWGTPAGGDSWGSGPAADTAKDSWGSDLAADKNGAGDAWATGDMEEALPDADGKREPRPAPFEQREAPVQPWVERRAYDYDTFTSGNGTEWDSNARVYEWDGEEGDIGPEHPELEEILFGKPEERDPQGIDFSKIAEIDVKQESEQRIDPIRSFATAGLHPVMLRNVELCGFKVPTPIQKYCIPAIKMGRDVIAIAQTGSGKTAAYLVPILNHLMGKAKKLAAPRANPRDIADGRAIPTRAEPLVVVVCPARELAVQIFNEARKFCYRTMLRPCVVYGGGPLRDQIDQLMKGCDILIASPGRLIDMMERPGVLTLRRVKYMVIDEADEMLHADWEEEFNKILSGGEQEEGNIKYMLFSATFPVAVRKLAKTHLAESHVRIRVGRIGSTHENIKQDIVWVDQFQKKRALLDYIYSKEPGRTIIFVNNKRVADELDDYLFHEGLPCTSMHSDRTQREREDSMRAFRSGNAPIMITTGVSARGIDVKNVKYVINYDLPSSEHGGITEYIHRIGRTGRIGHQGQSMSFYTERDQDLAELLTFTLLETKNEVPDFLVQYIPQDNDMSKLKFEPDSDEVEDPIIPGPSSGGDGGSWGGGGDSWDAGGDASGGGSWDAGTSAGAGGDAWDAGGSAGAGGDSWDTGGYNWGSGGDW